MLDWDRNAPHVLQSGVLEFSLRNIWNFGLYAVLLYFIIVCSTAWKVSKYEAFSGPYFPVFNPKTGKCDPEKNSIFGHFSRNIADNISI